jgi:hypothetical protein
MCLCVMDMIGHLQVYVSHTELATENLPYSFSSPTLLHAAVFN